MVWLQRENLREVSNRPIVVPRVIERIAAIDIGARKIRLEPDSLRIIGNGTVIVPAAKIRNTAIVKSIGIFRGNDATLAAQRKTAFHIAPRSK
jgi:hypothetical protein